MHAYMCVHVCPVTVIASMVQSITRAPRLHPPSLLPPSFLLSPFLPPEVMSLRADGAQIKLTPSSPAPKY